MPKLPKIDFSKWINRKTISIGALVLLLGVLTYAKSLSLTAPTSVRVPPPSPTPTEKAQRAVEATGDFFKDFRAQRETARTDEIALLDSIINREGAPKDSVRDADARKIALTTYTEQERAIEKQLIAKGFEDAAAFIQEGSVSIIVRKEKLTEAESAKILETALRESGQDAANIKIIPVA